MVEEMTADLLLELAWGIIANAGWDEWSGDVNQEKTEGWLEATLRWRKDYFEYLDRILLDGKEEPIRGRS